MVRMGAPVALMWVAGVVHGQEEEPSSASDDSKSWSAWMTGEQRSLNEAMAAFDAQKAWRQEPRSCGEKAFERWSWWASERGGLHAMPDKASWWAATAPVRTSMASAAMLSTDTLEWSYLAPESVPTHGGAGRINRVRVDPHDAQHWYACAPSGGLWHSMNEGQTWEVFGIDVLSPLGVTDVWVDPNNASHLWVATGDGNGGDTYSIGILETHDGGSTWSPLELSFEVNQGRVIHAMQPHPTSVDTAFVGTDLGLFVTMNGGQSFELVLSGGSRDVVWVNDSTAVAGVQNQGAFRTTDWGATWTACALPENLNSVGRIQLAGQAVEVGQACDTLYAVAGHYFQQNFLAFWRSVDGGATWTAEATRSGGPNLLGFTVSGSDYGGQAFWDLCIAVDPEDAEHVLVGGVNVWETTNGGATWNCPLHWQGASEAKYTHADQHGITWLGDGSVVLGNDGGVFRWNGEHITDLSAGLEITQGYALGIHPEQPGRLLVGTQDNGTTLVQPDWEARILDGDGFHTFFDPAQQGRLYASAYYGLLYRSDDGGRTMTNIANYLQSSGPNEVGAWQTPFELHPAVPGRIVAAKKSVHFSDDGGESWTSWGGLGTVRATAMALTGQDAEAALIAKNSDLYWRDSTTTTFNPVFGLPEIHIGDVAIDEDDMDAWWIAFGAYEDGQQVWRTEDQGASWENVSEGLPTLPIHVVKQLDDGRWVCGSDMGVHLWDEDNMSWSNMGSGLPLTPVVDVAVDPLLNRLVASTYGRGLWACPLPSAPDVAGAIVTVTAPQTQCMGLLAGQPRFRFSGTDSLSGVHCVLECQQGGLMLQDTVWTDFVAPVHHGEEVTLHAFHFEVPNAGAWNVSAQAWSSEHGALGAPFVTTLYASGLGHTSSMTWWGDCESADIRWELRDATNQDVLLQSAPLAASDTITTTWCLAEGCYELVWNDLGEDGFSGAYCGEPGGYILAGPFGDTVSEANGLDFGGELEVPLCVAVPWCYADFNGDGARGVDDLLTVLSEFGCPSACTTDTDFDDSVGVSDLMNMLSVYGQGCSID